MTSSRTLVVVGAALLQTSLVACGGSQSDSDRATDPASVLIVMVDALRADRLGVNGYPLSITPNIDRLAEQGINFRRAFAHSTWTKPSIATLFTSVYPSQHGVTQVAIGGSNGPQGEVLAPDWTTLAERFRAAEYRTGAIVNQVHIRPRFGFDQGFEEFQARRGTAAPRLNRRLLAWLETLPAGEPFFAYLHYLDVHWPYTHRAPAGTEGLGAADLSVEPPRSGRTDVQAWGQTLELPADLEALEARYDHEVAFADHHVGLLMSALRDLDRFDDTIVVVTADHGEGFLEHGQLLHGYAPYEEMIHVPLVLRLPPDLRADLRSVEMPVGLVDLMPTLLELTGLAPEPQAMGRSLAPLISGAGQPSRLIFAESSEALAVRGMSHKLIRFRDGREEYFDLSVDPAESSPLPSTGDCGESCRRLERGLDGVVAMLARWSGSTIDLEPLEAQDLEELRSLGYID